MRRVRRLVLALLLLVMAGEVFARVRLYRHFKDTGYLTAPFWMKRPAGNGVSAPLDASNPAAVSQAAVQTALADRQYFVGYYKMVPGERRGARGSYRINALGFRGPDFSATKGIRTRIFAVGDSNTIGVDLPEDETWPALLQQSLNRQTAAVEVVNAGIGGYTSSHALNLIRSELLGYAPDVLIVFVGVNDLNEDRGPATGTRVASAIHNRLYYHWSMLYTLSVEKVSVMRTASPVPVTVYDDSQINGLTGNASAIIDACRSRGVKPVFVSAVVNPDSAGDLMIYRMQQAMNGLKQLCERRQVGYLDVRPALLEARTRGATVFSDPIHLSAAGHRVVAEQVAHRVGIAQTPEPDVKSR